MGARSVLRGDPNAGNAGCGRFVRVRMKPKILICLCLFNLLFAASFLQMRESLVSVSYHDKDRETATQTLELLSRQQAELQERYGLTPKNMEIYIAESKAEYAELAGMDSPEWSSGLASGGRMLVKSPAFSRQTMPEYRQTLLHEGLHLALSHMQLPVWFNEGLAQYEAGTFGLSQKIELSRAITAKRLMPLQEIEGLYEMSRERAGLAYAQSVAAVDVLISRYGPSLLEKILYFTEKYGDFSLAFRNVYLMTPAYFEKVLQEALKERYRFYILLDVNGMFWFFVAGLFILGYILTKIRRYRLLKKWEQAETEVQYNESNDTISAKNEDD